MNRMAKTMTAAALALFVGCVVIPNTLEVKISIDIRHIQEQANQLLDYVEGKSETPPETDAAEPEARSTIVPAFRSLYRAKVAYAAELKDSSPRVRQIADKMKARYDEVQALKKQGSVGESNRGLLELVYPAVLASEEAKNSAQRLVAAENEDRKALYQEVARINRDMNLKVAAVERVYAQRRLERAEADELFQLPPAGDDFDGFKSSTAGTRLREACVPDAWVRIK